MEPFVRCGNDKHQTSLKWDSSSHPATPECNVSHTLRLKHFTINVAGLLNRPIWFLGLVTEFVVSIALILCHRMAELY